MSAPQRSNKSKRTRSSTSQWQICHHCHSGTTTVVTSLPLPADEGADETLLLLQGCSSCGTHFVAIANESRRGSRDRETVWGYGYQLNEQDATRLKNLLKRNGLNAGSAFS